MSSENFSEKKAESLYTKCENCRQNILSDKMFLHEGFCQRNNTYCDHCDKVFLKTDYEEHLKDLRNSMTNSAKSTDIDETEYIPIIHEIKQSITTTTTVNPNTYYEFVEMPLTEEYTINSPIVISEGGQILSSQNNNDYILLYLGINATDNYNYNYGIEYGLNDIYNSNDNSYMQNNFDYLLNNQNEYRNDNYTQINFINNNANYHLNNYQINLNVSNNEQKEIKKCPTDKQKKKTKIPLNKSKIAKNKKGERNYYGNQRSPK